MTAIVFTRRDDAWYSVRFHHYTIAEAADLIALSVPPPCHAYEAATRTWLVDASWSPVLAADLIHRGHTVVGIEPREPWLPPDAEHEWATTLFTRVGPDRTDAVYQMLAQALGRTDPKLMRQLNRARYEIEKGDQ